MYCEGGRSRTGKLSEQPKRGIGRLALESGATVVPAAIHGSSKVRNWKRLQFPKVTVQYGEPMRWEAVEDPTADQQQQVANEIFAQIRGLYAGLDSLGRKGVARRLREARRRRPPGARYRLTSSQVPRHDVVGVDEHDVRAGPAVDRGRRRRRPRRCGRRPRRPGSCRASWVPEIVSSPGPPSIWSVP